MEDPAGNGCFGVIVVVGWGCDLLHRQWRRRGERAAEPPASVGSWGGGRLDHPRAPVGAPTPLPGPAQHRYLLPHVLGLHSCPGLCTLAPLLGSQALLLEVLAYKGWSLLSAVTETVNTNIVDIIYKKNSLTRMWQKLWCHSNPKTLCIKQWTLLGQVSLFQKANFLENTLLKTTSPPLIVLVLPIYWMTKKMDVTIEEVVLLKIIILQQDNILWKL